MAQFVDRVAHTFRRQGLDLSPRAVVVFLLLACLIALLGATRLVLASWVTAEARDLQEARREYLQLQKTNSALEEEISAAQSAQSLLVEAYRIGMRLPLEIENVRP
jgi:hypothetical protein